MKVRFPFSPVCVVLLFASIGAYAKAKPAVRVSGKVHLAAVQVTHASSTVHFVASSSTTCAKGISAMGIYTGFHRRVFTVKGNKLDATIKLPPGKYDAVVQEWDNCHSTAKVHVPLVMAKPAKGNDKPTAGDPPSDNPPPSEGSTSTLSAKLANNTSAADTFKTQKNGNLGAGNVSKVDIRTLLYPGATSEIYAELQPWFGDHRHMEVGYSSWDPAQVEKQLTDMMSRGITGVVIDWYGPSDRTEPTTVAWMAAAENHPGFKVIIMIDKGAVSLSPCQGCNPTQTMIYLTKYVMDHYASSPAYATWNGKAVITEFDLDLHFKFDWKNIEASTPSNIARIFMHSSGFAHANSAGSYSWMNATSKTFGMDYLTNFYKTAAKSPDLMAWGAGYKGFNDTLASWSLRRVVGQNCGQTWLQSFEKLNSYYNSGNQLPILQLVTWNDYEEGTEMESGIDNCLTVSASAAGAQLKWSVNGNENTVDHYTIFFSPDGENLRELNNLPAGTHTMDLSPFSLGEGSVYVQAVGKPSIKNQMSGAVKTQ
ncbi:MAG TPA: hypothetical protein VH088_22320 [Terriglobales bacterium]|nr:hypothetical protein [Terriglobales bacterium]